MVYQDRALRCVRSTGELLPVSHIMRLRRLSSDRSRSRRRCCQFVFGSHCGTRFFIWSVMTVTPSGSFGALWGARTPMPAPPAVTVEYTGPCPVCGKSAQWVSTARVLHGEGTSTVASCSCPCEPVAE